MECCIRYAAFYTSLIEQRLPLGGRRKKCIKSAPFIHMLIFKNIVFSGKITSFFKYTFTGYSDIIQN